MDRYILEDCIYTSPMTKVAVFAATDKRTQAKVIVKLVTTESAEELAAYRKEVDNHQVLNTHPYVCKLYDSFVTDEGGRFRMMLVLEKCQCDFMRLFLDRAATRSFYDEQTLWAFLSECVSALAFAQEHVRNI